MCQPIDDQVEESQDVSDEDTDDMGTDVDTEDTASDPSTDPQDDITGDPEIDPSQDLDVAETESDGPLDLAQDGVQDTTSDFADADAEADALADTTDEEPNVCSGIVSDAFDDGLFDSCWLTEDIGGASAGSETETDSLVVTANGADIGMDFDQFRYIYRPFCGDIEITLRVNYVPVIDEDSRAGLMLREELTSGARYSAVFATNQNGYKSQRRFSPGQNTSVRSAGTFTNNPSSTVPGYVRLIRSEHYFSAFYSDDGGTWIEIYTAQWISMSYCIYAGIAVTSHSDVLLGTASFNDLVVVSGGYGP